MSNTDNTAPLPPLPSKITMLVINNIHVDHLCYQRDLKPGHVQRMKDGFDPFMFYPALVSLRPDGTHWMIDGQQRTAAAKDLGYIEIPCIVIPVDSVEQEAERFTKFDSGRKNLLPFEKFRAAHTAQRPLETTIQNELEKLDLTALSPGSSRNISGVGVLREPWGSAAAKPSYSPNPEMTEAGARVLRDALYCGVKRVNEGNEAADRVFDKIILGGIIWIIRKSDEPPEFDAVQSILASVHSDFVRASVHGPGSYGGSGRGQVGLNLADWLNDRAGRKIVHIPDAIRRRLRPCARP